MLGPHDKTIAMAAKDALSPLGFHQKGQSRLWLRDNGWWLTAVEFQPSGWEKGSYLNVGAHWLWSGMGFLSFDVSERADGFASYETDSQFAPLARGLAELAALEAEKLGSRFRSIDATATELVAHQASMRDGGWPRYDAGMASGIAGRSSVAVEMFSSITHEPVRTAAKRMVSLAEDQVEFRKVATDLVARQRQALSLPHVELPVF